MTIGVEGNCRGGVLEKQEGTGNEAGVHMEDLVSSSSHHTIQERCLQDSDCIDGSLTSSKKANSWYD